MAPRVWMAATDPSVSPEARASATRRRRKRHPMAKVVVVDASSRSRDALATALIEAGYEVAVAPGGSYAVTMLEWERPDVVVCSAEVEDMDSCELFALIRDEPTTRATPFLLLAGHDRAIALAAAKAGVEIAITGDINPEVVVTQIQTLLGQRSNPPGLQCPGPVAVAGDLTSIDSVDSLCAALRAAEAPCSDGPAAAAIDGSLRLIDAPEVMWTIALSGKTGCLIVSLAGLTGVVLFVKGWVVHAGFEGKTGEAAFRALLSALCGNHEARFRFNPAPHAAVTHLPKTISCTVEQLLLSSTTRTNEAAVGSDEPARASAPAMSEPSSAFRRRWRGRVAPR